jgi:hypothetical protein
MDSNLIPVDGRPGTYLDLANNVLLTDGGNGQLVKMDLGSGDVHVDTALATFATGFRQADLAADTVMPIVPVQKMSDVYYEFNADNEMAGADGTVVTGGAAMTEVNPQQSTTPFTTTPYALAGFLPLELLGNQDAILNLQFKTIRTIMAKLQLNREKRVAAALFNSANYSSTHIVDLSAVGATRKWNGGSASTPVRDIQSLCEASLARITHMVMSLDTWNAFTVNPDVQKFLAFKSAAPALPSLDQRTAFSALLGLPMPVVCEARARTTTAGVYPYIWSGSVALVHQQPGVPADGYTTATAKTFRWTGGETIARDAASVNGVEAAGGIVVRSMFKQDRGPLGGIYMVVTHRDAEQFITDKVSGLVKGAFQ